MILVKIAVSYIQPQDIRSFPVYYNVLGYVCSCLATFRIEGRLYMGHNFSQAKVSVLVLIHASLGMYQEAKCFFYQITKGLLRVLHWISKSLTHIDPFRLLSKILRKLGDPLAYSKEFKLIYIPTILIL